MRKVEKIGSCIITEGEVKNFFGFSIIKNEKIVAVLSAIGSFLKGDWGYINPYYCSRSGASWAVDMRLSYGYSAVRDLKTNEIQVFEDEIFSFDGALYHIYRSKETGCVEIKFIWGDCWSQSAIAHSVQYINEKGESSEVSFVAPGSIWEKMSRRTQMFLAMQNCGEDKPLEVKTFEMFGRNPLFRFMGNRIMIDEKGQYFLTCSGYAVKKLGDEREALMFSLKYLKASGTPEKFHFFQKNPGCEEGNWIFVICERGEDYEISVDENCERTEEDIWRECRAGIVRKLAQTRSSSIEEVKRVLDGEGIISVEDSLEAGNCLPGTKDFLERFGLKEPVLFKILCQHPRFEEMLKIAAFRKAVMYTTIKNNKIALNEEDSTKSFRSERKVRVKRIVTDETGEETESAETSE